MSYTTSDLISEVKALASIPTSQSLFTTADFLRFANNEIQTNLIPMIMGAREEYFVQDYDHAVTANQAAYSIPSRAIGGKLRDVQIVDGTTLRSLARLEPEFISSTDNNQQGFYLKANKVVLVPTPLATDGTSLRLSHFRRPGKLVATTEAMQVTSIDSANNQVVVSSVPSTFAVGETVDFIKEGPGFDCLSIDVAITAITGTTITLASLPSDLAVGDWIALAGESPIPQIPLELHSLLAQMVAVRCLMAQGKKSEVEQGKLEEMKRAALYLLTPRIDGEPKKIVSPNSLLQYFRRGW